MGLATAQEFLDENQPSDEPSILEKGVARRDGRKSAEVTIRCPQLLDAMMSAKGSDAGIMDEGTLNFSFYQRLP